MDSENVEQAGGNSKIVEQAAGNSSEAETSGTTVEIRIRTLDSSSYTIRVDKNIPVPALKEQLASLVGVPSQNQRLICRGRVLKDDQLLSSYNVEDGHTLHLVARPAGEGQGEEAASQGQTDSTTGAQHGRPAQVTHSLLLGTINIPNVGEGGLPDFNRIVSAVLGSVGNAQAANIGGTASGPAVSVQQGLHPAPQRQGSLPLGTNQFLPRSFEVPPDALTTLSLYLSRMEQMFASNGFGSTPSSLSSPLAEAAPAAPAAPPSLITNSRPVMTPAALGATVRRVHGLLTSQAAVTLTGLAGQLENEASLVDIATRVQVQAAAVWSGNIMQQLGALLMELGRTTLTLHMGHVPAEAIVNSGPAVFISPSGPNPIMVQPSAFLPVSSFASRTPQLPGGWPGVVGPRSLNIHIHTSDVGIPPTTNPPPAPPATAGGPQQTHLSTTGQTQVSETRAADNTGGTLRAMPDAVVQETIMIVQDNGDARVVSSRSRNLNPIQPGTSSEGTAGANSDVPVQTGSTDQAAQVAQALNQMWPGGLAGFRPIQQTTQPTGPASSMSLGSNVLSSMLETTLGQLAPGLQPTLQNQLQGQAFGSISQTSSGQGLTFNLPLQFTAQMIQQAAANSSAPLSTPPDVPSEPASSPHQSIPSSISDVMQSHHEPAQRTESASSDVNKEVSETSKSLAGTSSSQSQLHSDQEDKRVPEAPAEASAPVGLGLGRLQPLSTRQPRRRSEVRHYEDRNNPSARADDGARRATGSLPQRIPQHWQPDMLQSRAGQATGQNNLVAGLMGQLMRSPALETIAQQVMQSMGDAPTSGETPSGEQNIDIGRMLHQALPMVSQLLAGGTASGRLQQPALNSGTLTSDRVVNPGNNLEASDNGNAENSVNTEKVPIDSAVQKLELGESAEDVMRAVAQAAAENAPISLTDAEVSELVQSVAQADGLSDAYLSMILQDLCSRQASRQ